MICNPHQILLGRWNQRHSSPYCCWSLWWISADGTFSPMRNLITMRCSTLRGTFCSLITLATPREDWTGSNPSRREGGGCGFTLSRSHSCCSVRLFYTQISPGLFEPPCTLLSTHLTTLPSCPWLGILCSRFSSCSRSKLCMHFLCTKQSHNYPVSHNFSALILTKLSVVWMEFWETYRSNRMRTALCSLTFVPAWSNQNSSLKVFRII